MTRSPSPETLLTYARIFDLPRRDYPGGPLRRPSEIGRAIMAAELETSP